LLKQNEFIDAFEMVHQTSNRHMQTVMNNLKFKILDYLAAKKSVCFGRHRDFSDWSVNSSSIWKIVPIIPVPASLVPMH